MESRSPNHIQYIFRKSDSWNNFSPEFWVTNWLLQKISWSILNQNEKLMECNIKIYFPATSMKASNERAWSQGHHDSSSTTKDNIWMHNLIIPNTEFRTTDSHEENNSKNPKFKQAKKDCSYQNLQNQEHSKIYHSNAKWKLPRINLQKLESRTTARSEYMF